MLNIVILNDVLFFISEPTLKFICEDVNFWELGYIKLLITLVPKVLKQRFLIRWIITFEECNWFGSSNWVDAVSIGAKNMT